MTLALVCEPVQMYWALNDWEGGAQDKPTYRQRMGGRVAVSHTTRWPIVLTAPHLLMPEVASA